MGKLECQKGFFSSVIRACGYEVNLDIDKTSSDTYVVTVDIDTDGRLSRYIISCDADTALNIEECLKGDTRRYIEDICATFKQFTC